MQSPFMNVKAVCEYLDVSRAMLYRKIEAGEIAKPARDGGREYYRRAYVEEVACKKAWRAMDVELGL